MSSLQQMFPFNNNLVRRLLNWRQSDEEETWRGKAYDTLVKKLSRPPNEQYSTFLKVLEKKNENTPCVTLPRSQDGRLQVSHRKMLPHVMYCRIFRWPDLQSHHELRSVPICSYPAQRREQSKVCINPYHYSRVDHNAYPPIVTPRSTEFADPPSVFSTRSSEFASPTDRRNNNNSEFPNASPPQPESPLSGSNYNSPPYNNSHLTPIPTHHQSPFAHHQSPPPQDDPNDPFNCLRNNQSQNSFALNSYYSSQSPMSDSANWYRASNNVVSSNGGLQNFGDSFRHTGALSQFNNQSSPPPAYSRNEHQASASAPMDVADDATQQTDNTLDGNHEHWCQITYAELNQKIGEPFKGSSPEVIVDGFTDPSVHNRRFSLGILSNINRNSTIEMTRRAIRKGICLENQYPQIYVRNLSESSIFFHSKNCNVENQLNQHTVVKIEPQGRQKIFDQKVFENLVQEAIKSSDGDTYRRLFSLTEHCIIRMSFVKGWGSVYQRQDVTSTPCWIEIHLLKPYAYIDQYLPQMKPPSCQITSTS